MNNQAAQTMPSLVDRVRECHAAWAAYNAVAPGEDRALGTEKLLTEVLAALSQTAGVVEPDTALLVSMATCLNHGFGLLDPSRQQSMLRDMRKLWDEVMGRGYYRPERADFYMGMINPVRADALAAAPAASGGEDGWSLAMRVREALDRASCPDHFMRIAVETITGDAPQPPAAASVSERARALLAASYRQSGDKAQALDVERRIPYVHHAIALRALEQALTQKRGGGPSDAGGDVAEYQIRSLDPYSGDLFFGWKKITKNEYDRAERQAAMSSNELTRIELRKLYTTPQPGAEALRELVQRWRAEPDGQYDYDQGHAHGKRDCADELESLLARGG